MNNALLVYDDNPEMIDYIASVANRRDFSVLQASTSDAFWRAYEELGEGGIVLDLVLDGAHGIAVLGELAERDCRAPILLISGCHVEILSSALRLGTKYGLDIRGALQKPFAMDDLVAQLGQLRN